jgi:hypothetical protein
MATRIEEDDEVGRMITVRRASSTDGLRVRRSLVQITNMQVEVKLLGYRDCPARSEFVIDRQLEVQRPLEPAIDCDPVVLSGPDLPAEQGRIELASPCGSSVSSTTAWRLILGISARVAASEAACRSEIDVMKDILVVA